MLTHGNRQFPTRWYRVHLFRCYRRDVRKFTEVLAATHERAAMIAAHRMGWKESEVITRYIVTRCVSTEELAKANAA